MQSGPHLIGEAHRTIRFRVPNSLVEELMECCIGAFDWLFKPGRGEYDPRYFCVETYARSEQSAVGNYAARSAVRKLDAQRLPGGAAEFAEYAVANGDGAIVDLGMTAGRGAVAIDRIPEDEARGIGRKQYGRRASVVNMKVQQQTA